jgi:hypothetical protein
MDSIKYCNELLARVEELMFHELSGMVCWKVEYVGVDYIRAKKIQGKNVDEVVKSVSQEIVADGIAKEIIHKTGGKGLMLKLKVKGCVHQPKEAHIKKEGIAPYICPIANMVLDQIHEKLKYETSYLAKLAIDEASNQCIMYMALYETGDKIGEISDWLEGDEDKAWLESQPSQILAPKM